MTNEPLVTCIIPTRNRPDLLIRALDSVLSQTYSNIEIIVVVGPPEEPTRNVLEDYEEYNQHIKSVYRQSAEGPSVARNTGIHEASGKYIAFLDDDDFWKPEKIEMQVPLLRRYSIASCLPILSKREERHNEEFSDKYINEVDINDIFNGQICYTSCMMFRTKELQAVNGFTEELLRDEILDLALQIMKTFSSMYVVNHNLAVIGIGHDLGHISDQTEKFEDKLTVYNRHKDAVRSDIARKKFVKLAFKGYLENTGVTRYKYLLSALRRDYELKIFRFFFGQWWKRLHVF